MDNEIFNFQLGNDTVIFTDTLKKHYPYISKTPRDHESIFLVTKGNLLYEKNGIEDIIKEGQIGYISKGSVDVSYAYQCDEVSYIAVNFCFERENTFHRKSLPFKTLCSKNTFYNYEKLFKEALNNFLSKTPGYITICNGIVIQIIGLLYNEYMICDTRMRKARQIENAIEYLKKNYDKLDFKISDLAYQVYMSEKNFRRIFYEVYNKNPYTFLQEFRINKSKILLLNTYKTISDIALQCGFSDVYSFSHCFKKHAGVSPIEYRANGI